MDFLCPSQKLLQEETNKEQNQVFIEKIEGRYARSNPSLYRKSSVTLPVVFHIIHDNGIENISDARITQEIDNLNRIFSNDGNYESTNGVNTGISFCLAQRTPDNQNTNGVNRIVSSQTFHQYPEDRASLKSLSQWDSRDYINIWVVRSIRSVNGNIAGYATYPFSHGFVDDGIVIEARFIGSSINNSKILAHEMGHYLGLYHTFTGGCVNDDCLSQGDRVCDTPPDQHSSSLPCGTDFNSCNSDTDDDSNNNPYRDIALGGLGDQVDMKENYMAYSYTSCYDRFTLGQRDRMCFFLEEVRHSLKDSKGCLEPCPDEINLDFTPNNGIFEAGIPILFEAQVMGEESLRWRINGRAVGSSLNLNYSFTEEGFYWISLTAYSSDIRCDSVVVSYMIEIQCPVEAGLQVNLREDSLFFRDQSINAEGIDIKIYNESEVNIYTTSSVVDTVVLIDPGYYKICVEANGTNCSDTLCTYVRYYGDTEENCELEGDEDGDGLADHFDPDCECVDGLYHAVCPINCEYLPDSFPEFEMKMMWESREMIRDTLLHLSTNLFCGDTDGNGDVEIYAYRHNLRTFPDPNEVKELLVFNGESGLLDIDFPIYDSLHNSSLALGDYNNDGRAELFTRHSRDYMCIGQDGSINWKTRCRNVTPRSRIGLADFNGDGIMEMYDKSEIYNSLNGALLGYSNVRNGCTALVLGNCSFSNTVAADLLPNPGLELAAGNVVYTIEINNLNDTLGNVITPNFGPDTIPDGLTVVGDINGDQELDVIVFSMARLRNSSYRPGRLYVYDPRNRTTIAHIELKEELGGMPFIGDVDGDCLPEIGLVFKNKLVMLKYNGTTSLDILYEVVTTDKSGWTGITMFDFNQDGKNELVYRDETDLRILEGATGRTLASTPMKSHTASEYPLVVDIDQDGEAEILVTGYLGDIPQDRVYAFESAGAPWAPARPVWNQYAYHSTNINDDLTVPRVQQNMAKHLEGYEDCLRETCPAPYNGFLVQSTHRTQAGCVQFPAVDLSIKILGYDCNPDSITLQVEICNGSDGKPVKQDWCIGTYSTLTGIPNLIQYQCYRDIVDTLSCIDTIEMKILTPTSLEQLYLVVNDDGSGGLPLKFPITNLVECDYTNNVDSVNLGIQEYTLDLGDDIVKCESEVIDLQAPSGFSSYLWSDLTNDTTYSSGDEGLHWLEVTDQCGRVYRDSLRFIIDDSGQFELGGDMEDCPGTQYDVDVAENYENIWWFPSGTVECDTCFSTLATIQDTTTLLIAVSQSGPCTYMDTIRLIPKVGEQVEVVESICEGDSILFYGNYYHDEGEYFHTTADCDSTIMLALGIRQNVLTPLESEICEGDSILWGSEWLKETGLYARTLMASNGCDSIISLDLQVRPRDSSDLVLFLCFEDTIVYNAEIYTQSGMYEVLLQNQESCDSLIQLEIRDIPNEYRNVEIQFCRGDSTLYNGEWYSTEGMREVPLTNQRGCDSIILLNVVERDTLHEEENYMLCPDETVTIEGEELDMSGSYPFYLSSQAGCDSVFTANVVVLSEPDEPEVVINCEDGTAVVSVPSDQVWQVVWSNGDTTWMTNYNEGAMAEAVRTTEDGCTVVQELEVPELPNITILPEFNDTTLAFGEGLSFMVDLDDSEWMINWLPESNVSCSNCMEISIDPSNGLIIKVEMIHSSGCIYRDEFLINIESGLDIYVPNAFSPNDDNNNDEWRIYLPEEIEQLDRVMIFDRWGSQLALWENTNDVRWDGYYQGKRLNPAVFAYLIEYQTPDGERHIKTGDITLIR